MINRIEPTDFPLFKSKIGKYDLFAQKLDIIYNKGDSRCWTALVAGASNNIIVTCHLNKDDLNEEVFDILASSRVSTDISTDDIYQTIDQIFQREGKFERPSNITVIEE